MNKEKFYGELSCVYDKNLKTITVKINQLTDKGKYLFEHSCLFIVPEGKNSRNACSPYKTVEKDKSVRWRKRLAVSWGNRPRRWLTIGKPRKIESIGTGVMFTIDDLEISKHGNGRALFKRWRKKYSDTLFMKIKFCLYGGLGVQSEDDAINHKGRFLRTKCSVFELPLKDTI